MFDSPVARLSALEVELGLPRHALNRFIAQSKAWKRLETGNSNPSQFREEFDADVERALAANTPSVPASLASVSGGQVLATLYAGSHAVRSGYKEAIASLKGLGFKTVALTNNFQSAPGACHAPSRCPSLYF